MTTTCWKCYKEFEDENGGGVCPHCGARNYFPRMARSRIRRRHAIRMR